MYLLNQSDSRMQPHRGMMSKVKRESGRKQGSVEMKKKGELKEEESAFAGDGNKFEIMLFSTKKEQRSVCKYK